MATIPAKTKERLISGVKKFKPIINKALSKDVNESDTVSIITDMLSEIFGYDKYSEITSEYAIKKTFCDLAINIDGKPVLLIESKAIGLELKDDHVRQAVDYGSNSGVEWIILTNAKTWRVYKVIFAKPIEQEFVYEFDFRNISTKRQSDIDMLFYLTKDVITKSSVKNSLEEYRSQKQLLSRFFIGQVLMTNPVIDCVRKSIKKIAPESQISNDEILEVISGEIIKREVLEGEKIADVKKRVLKLNMPTKNKK